MPQAALAQAPVIAPKWWAPWTPAERARRREASNLRRSRILPCTSATWGQFEIAFRAAFPWDIDDYPGLVRGLMGILGKDRITTRQALRWRKGEASAPRWAVDAICSYLRARGEAMLRAAGDLEASLETHQRPPQGFCVVDPATGMDKRGGRVGRRKERELKAKDIQK